MCKKLFFIAFVLLSCNSLFSQDPIPSINPIQKRDQPFRIAAGIKVGGGMSLPTDPTVVTSAYPSGYALDFKNGLALQAGAVGNIHFGRRQDSSPGGTGWIGAQAEVLYGLRTLGTEHESLTMHCLEIPVLLQVYPIPSLAIELGPTFVKYLKCTPETLQVGEQAINIRQWGEASDVMLSIGANYKIPAGIMFDLRYNLGTSSLAGNFDTKTSTFMVSIAYLFSFGKQN